MKTENQNFEMFKLENTKLENLKIKKCENKKLEKFKSELCFKLSCETWWYLKIKSWKSWKVEIVTLEWKIKSWKVENQKM